MKQQLTEALAWYADMTYLDEKDAPMVAAARLVERLLPGECGSCKGKGWLSSETELLGYDDPPLDRLCRVCDGSGQVWDEGIVEAVADVLIERRVTHKDQLRTFTDAVATCREDARAVLSALAGLLTEKSEPPKDPWDYDP